MPRDSFSHEQLVVFGHIPKCAGASFWVEVAPRVPLSYPLLSDLPRHGTLARGCGTALGSHHCDLRELASCAGGQHPARVVTVVRDPVSRVLSEYAWAIREKPRKVRRGFVGQFDWPRNDWNALGSVFSMEELAKWIDGKDNTAHNRQARFLGGLGEPQAGRCAHTNSTKTFAAATRRYGAAKLKSAGFAKCIAEDQGLERDALRALRETVYFVGVAERLSDSVRCLLENKLGLPPPPPPLGQSRRRHIHESAHLRGKVPVELRRRIAALNALDGEVYDAGKRRFETECPNVVVVVVPAKKNKSSPINIPEESFVAVTAFSENHAKEGRLLLVSAQRAKLPLTVLFDLGLAEKTRASFADACGVEVRDLPSDIRDRFYPRKDLEGCAWKPRLIREMLKERTRVLWVDASVRFGRGAVDAFSTMLATTAIVARRTVGTVAEYSHPDSARALGTRSEILRRPMLAATIVGVTAEATAFVDKWTHYCLDAPHVFAPPKARGQPCSRCVGTHDAAPCYKCHRFDQTIFNLLRDPKADIANLTADVERVTVTARGSTRPRNARLCRRPPKTSS